MEFASNPEAGASNSCSPEPSQAGEGWQVNKGLHGRESPWRSSLYGLKKKMTNNKLLGNEAQIGR